MQQCVMLHGGTSLCDVNLHTGCFNVERRLRQMFVQFGCYTTQTVLHTSLLREYHLVQCTKGFPITKTNLFEYCLKTAFGNASRTRQTVISVWTPSGMATTYVVPRCRFGDACRKCKRVFGDVGTEF